VSKQRSAPAKKQPALQNEGEGSRSAARRYDAAAERAAKDPAQTEKLAKDAEKALAGPDAASLREAAQRGKAGKHR
jgi:hypothetical protein